MSLDAHPDKALTYFSPRILERRQRLLKETRKMIAESGYENFSVRKLCERASVAQKTLYNAFQNKDRLVVLAIREAYDDFHKYTNYTTDRNTVAGILDRAVALNRQNMRVPNYIKAVVTIYFGSTTNHDVWESLHSLSITRTLEWLQSMKRNGDLMPWVNESHFADAMANMQYSTINDWCQGRVKDQEFLPLFAENILVHIAGSVRGGVRAEAEGFLAELHATGKVPDFSKVPQMRVTQRKAASKKG